MNNESIEKFITHHSNKEVQNNYCGTFAANQIFSFIDCADRLKKNNTKKLPYAIFNSDYSDKEGTHWYLIISINRQEVFVFDSLGRLSLNTFVITQRQDVIKSFLKPIEILSNAKGSPIQFNKMMLNAEKFIDSKKIDKLSDTAKGLFTLISGIGLTNKKQEIATYFLDDQLQETNSQWCGVFVCSMIHYLYAPSPQSPTFNKSKLDANLIEEIVRTHYNEGSISGRQINSERMNQFAKAHNLELEFESEDA